MNRYIKLFGYLPTILYSFAFLVILVSTNFSIIKDLSFIFWCITVSYFLIPLFIHRKEKILSYILAFFIGGYYIYEGIFLSRAYMPSFSIGSGIVIITYYVIYGVTTYLLEKKQSV